MNSQVIVVDDFYSDPDLVRRVALGALYAPKGSLSKNFPGQESVRHFYTLAIVEEFAALIGEKIIVNTARNAFGRFRVSSKADHRRTRIHFDNTKWTAIIYLSLEKDCIGGTELVRHKRTGLLGPPLEEKLRSLGYQNISDFDLQVVGPDTLNDAAWEQDIAIDMKFNRLVLIRGRDRFHGSTELFGSGLSDGRLTQVFFFDTEQSVP